MHTGVRVCYIPVGLSLVLSWGLINKLQSRLGKGLYKRGDDIAMVGCACGARGFCAPKDMFFSFLTRCERGVRGALNGGVG
jgi:hypothetical protein